MVGNLVVEIEIFNFCLFVCLFTCLFVPHVLPISQEENGQIMIPKNFNVIHNCYLDLNIPLNAMHCPYILNVYCVMVKRL